MRQTFFLIPEFIAGLPLFGWGIGIALWGLACGVLLTLRFRRHGWDQEARSYLPMMLVMGAVLVFLMPRMIQEIVVDTGGADGVRRLARGIPIRGYGVMLLLAIGSATYLAIRRAPRYGISTDQVVSLVVWLCVSGIVGARVFFVIQKWDQFPKHNLIALLQDIVNLVEGGLVVYGSFFGAMVGAVLFARRHQVKLLALADLAAPSVMLGLALGRIGCLMNGCCYGGVCDLPWAVTFPQDSPPYLDQQRSGQLLGFRLAAADDGTPIVDWLQKEGPAQQAGVQIGDLITAINGHSLGEAATNRFLIQEGWSWDTDSPHPQLEVAKTLVAMAGRTVKLTTNDGRQLAVSLVRLPPRSLPIHPTQIYSAINALLICLFLLAWSRRPHPLGQLFAWLIVLYPINRFFLEMIRTDESGWFGTGLTISQNMSIVLFVFGLALWIYQWYLPDHVTRGRPG